MFCFGLWLVGVSVDRMDCRRRLVCGHSLSRDELSSLCRSCRARLAMCFWVTPMLVYLTPHDAIGQALIDTLGFRRIGLRS